MEKYSDIDMSENHMTVDRTIRVDFPYIAMNDIMRVIKEQQPKIASQEFDNLCTMVLTIRESRAGELTARLTGATQAHDLARATKRYLRSMDFAVASVSEPLRESAGVYSVTAVQSLCGVPVFESALTFTYRNSALSRVDGTFYPAGETVRVSENACISCADALVCLLSSRDSLGWVGSEILSCEQGYVHSETASSAMRFVPVWRIETDAGTFHVSGITREVRQLVS